MSKEQLEFQNRVRIFRSLGIELGDKYPDGLNGAFTEISEGGFGAVFLTTDKDGHKVAVKILLPTNVPSQRSLSAEMVKEGSLLKKLQKKACPNFLKFESAFECAISHFPPAVRNHKAFAGVAPDSKVFAMVTEYIEGGDLLDMAFSIKDSRKLQILIDAAVGLRCLAKLGYLHGDIKPDNIMISEIGRGVIIDVGVSSKFDNDAIGRCVKAKYWGTPAYLPPSIVKDYVDESSYVLQPSPGSECIAVVSYLDIYSFIQTYYVLGANARLAGQNAKFFARIIKQIPTVSHLVPDMQDEGNVAKIAELMHKRSIQHWDFIIALLEEARDSVIYDYPSSPWGM